MNFSALSQNDRIALVAGAVVAIAGLLSIYFDWGWVMLISVFAGLLAVVAIVQPSMLGSLQITGSKGAVLYVAGLGAALLNVLRGVDALEWLLDNLATVDALQFIAGIVAAIVLLYAGWVAYRGESGMAPAMAPPPAPPPAPEPPAAG